MLQVKFPKIVLCLLFSILAVSVVAQTSRKIVKKKPAKKAVSTKSEAVSENTPTVPEVKKNSRPETEVPQSPTEKNGATVKTNERPVAAVETKPVYFYEFSKADFLISKIFIEHDENGKGKITFQKKDFNDPETDPLQLSPATLERLKTAWSALNFLDSTETYQTVRDYPQLGSMKFSMKKDGRERTATFNWTDNKDAKILADEYRRIGQQFVWIFDITVARENQPLEAPRQIDALDALIRRNEISDAAQMLPLLRELSEDERIPLIARNHAKRLVGEIEKNKSKK